MYYGVEGMMFRKLFEIGYVPVIETLSPLTWVNLFNYNEQKGRKFSI